MNKIAREALELSSKHWEENLAAATLEDASISASDCALCETFNMDRDSAGFCVGCPVFAKTREQFCGGTPYIDAICALDNWEEHDDPSSWRIVAQAELDFLKSLRETPDD